jgi:hypothetical protein
MSLAREVNQELEWEEDCCDRETATMRNAIVEEAECYKDHVATMTSIVEEVDSYGDYAASTMTSGYRVVGDKAPIVKQGLLNCPQDAVDSRFGAINRDMDKGFVRADMRIVGGTRGTPPEPIVGK